MAQDNVMKNKHLTEKIFTIILVLIYSISFGYFIIKGVYTNLITIGFCIAFTIAMYILHIKVPKLVDKGIFITLCGFVLFASYLGSCIGLYDLIKWYDDFLHFWSGIMFTQVGFVIVRYCWDGWEINKKSIIFVLIFVFFFTMGTASMWEIGEFLGDSWFGLNTQAGGLIDTCMDMIDALVGSIFILPHIYRLTLKLNIQQNE